MTYTAIRRAMRLLTRPTRRHPAASQLRKAGADARRLCRRWLADENVIGFGVGHRVTGGMPTDDLALRVHVLTKLPRSRLGGNGIPPALRLPGLTKPILIDVVEDTVGVGELALVGDGVSLSGSGEFGTMGCVVCRSGSTDSFLVTCRHVLNGHSGANVEWAEFPPAVAPPNPGIGTLTGFRSVFSSAAGFPNTTDIALVRLSPGAVSPVVRWLGPIAGVRSDDLRIGDRVRLCGFGSGLGNSPTFRGDAVGQVLEPHSNRKIAIHGHGELGFRDLVLCTQFTTGMDSGAGVFDDQNRLVGIHVAGSRPGSAQRWSAFQPIRSVFREFGLTLPAAADVAEPNSAPAAHAAGASQGRAQPRVGSPALAIDTLARTIWGEGRGEPEDGREAIANVVLNRVAKMKARRFGSTVEAVCRKKKQFSCWNAGDPNLPRLLAVGPNDAAFRECLDLARVAVNGNLRDNTLGSDHYHAVGTSASWAVGHTPAVVIHRHQFYNDIP